MFIGYHISDDGESVPMSTAPTKELAQASAIRRVLSLGITFGEIGAQESELADHEFETLTGILDKWFAEKGIN